jgi:D-lactate dehydrogenase (cytochrome)
VQRLTDPSKVSAYLTDASNLAGGHAEGVVVPESEREVAAFLRQAHDRRWPVTVAGCGCGVVGGRVPFGGWVLSTERLARLEGPTKRADAWTAVGQPGLPLSRLQEAVAAKGLMYGPDPTEGTAFLGGTVSTNASGARSFKYGVTRRHVRALRVVLADGRVLALRRGQARARRGRLTLTTTDGGRLLVPVPSYRQPSTKHVAGYFAQPNLDAVDLFVGAEGTLGVITEIELALLPAPEAVLGLIAFFPTEEASWQFAIRARQLARRRSRLAPRAIEYLDRESLALTRPSHPDMPPAAKAAIYLEHEARREDTEARLAEWRREVTAAEGFEQLWTARTPEEHAAFKAFRRALPVAVNAQRRASGQPKVGTDMAVPDAKLLELLRLTRKLLDRLGQPYCVFGHIGDNHFHANIMPRTPAELAKARDAHQQLVTSAIALGGTFSAEHGVGKLKRHFLGLLYGRRDVDQMRAVKEALDPNWILGVGNIFER